ncbi:TPA: hypothetical protein DEO28_02065 [Candidatus Dependentiae bacterium]|nr:MAG: hypothetical protein UR14_C0004G0095 [candidate division TM6 bacterium GW2011_GWE2_31_21]KKP53015.1 MAG: hypothetical protein UR43_C0008G0097 [candidate division TM6 bacterium GW2011_GWF2_33_332]HBS47748.1 hypothetical protein [Candidatus Dependentiae bacterium]HBZ73276.1 hypothetical protein [Candidatus Dependentiae bacterium]
MLKKISTILGPIILSALSFIISFFIVQPIAIYLDPSFNLLANRGCGKIAFSVMVLYQIILMLLFHSKPLLNKFLDAAIFSFADKGMLKKFLLFFSIFFILHATTQFIFLFLGFAHYNPEWGFFNLKLIWKISFAFFVVFLLAWSEEAIFRGMVYNYFNQFFTPLRSIFVTSFIFMLAHDLTNPLNLVTKNWKLGLGLFLLGFLLNLIFVLSGKLYISIASHMGLVAFKVLLRRAPFIVFASEEVLPFWVSADLRQSFLVHLFFILIIIILICRNYKKLVTS